MGKNKTFKFPQKLLFGRVSHVQKCFNGHDFCADYLTRIGPPFLKISSHLNMIYVSEEGTNYLKMVTNDYNCPYW